MTKNRTKVIIVAIIILIIMTFLLFGFEYGAYGMIMILLFSIKKIPVLLVSELIWNIVSIYLFDFSMYQTVAFLGIVLCAIIGNKKKTNIYKIIPRGFNYLVYPVHLLILLLFKTILEVV